MCAVCEGELTLVIPAGDGALSYKIEKPDWLEIVGALPTEGTLTKETRFVFSVIPQTKSSEALHSENASNDAKSSLVRHGEIVVFSGTQKICTIPVTDKTDDVKARVQKDAEDAKLTKAVALHVAIEDSCFPASLFSSYKTARVNETYGSIAVKVRL